VTDKLHAITVRDSERFAAAEHDPGTAPSLEQFRSIETTPWGTRVAQARLWGAPAWSAQSLASNVAAIVPTLTTFTRAAPREHLDGYVITGPALESPGLLGDWARAVLSELAGDDPKLGQLAGMQTKAPAGKDTLIFNGMRLSVTILSRLHPHVLLRPSA
jgi:hypothetical protein